MEKNFIKDFGGYTGEAFDHAGFLKELAAAIPGAKFIPDPDGNTGPYSLQSLKLANGVRIMARSDKGKSRATLRTYWDWKGQDRNGCRAEFPSITINYTRKWADLLKDITRRLIEPANVCAEEVTKFLAQRADEEAKLAEVVKEYQRLCPYARITPKDLEADISIYLENVGSLSGSLSRDGRLYVQRVAVYNVEASKALLSIFKVS